jgi:hypothetical protein
VDPVSQPNVLPDSRLKTLHTPQQATWRGQAGYWVPIYCANCGVHGGTVPEQNMTSAFWLCPKCFETYGAITGTYVMPDEVLWERVRQAQLEEFGRVLSAEELLVVARADASPLATLLHEDAQHKE